MAEKTTDFEMIAITRDLVRKPEVKFLAGILCKIATGSVDNNDIPPLFVRLAYRLSTKPDQKALLLNALDIV